MNHFSPLTSTPPPSLLNQLPLFVRPRGLYEKPCEKFLVINKTLLNISHHFTWKSLAIMLKSNSIYISYKLAYFKVYTGAIHSFLTPRPWHFTIIYIQIFLMTFLGEIYLSLLCLLTWIMEASVFYSMEYIYLIVLGLGINCCGL